MFKLTDNWIISLQTNVVVQETITLLISLNMANCKGCGMKVGCGCQLINGLCSACNNKLKNATKRLKNAYTKIDRLRNKW